MNDKRFLDLSKTYDSYRNPYPVAPLRVNRDQFEEIVRRASEQEGGELLKKHSIDELLGDCFVVYAKCDERLENIELWFRVEEQGVDVQIPLDNEEVLSLKDALKGAGREDLEKVREPIAASNDEDNTKKDKEKEEKARHRNRSRDYDYER